MQQIFCQLKIRFTFIFLETKHFRMKINPNDVPNEFSGYPVRLDVFALFLQVECINY